MDVPCRLLVHIAAVVDDRRLPHARAAVGDPPGSVRDAQGFEVAHGARGHVVAVVVVAADELIEIEELLLRDGPRVERRQTVLNSGVIERAARKAGGRVAPEDVHHVVVDVTAHTRRFRGLVVAHAQRNGRVAGSALRLHPDRVRRTDGRDGRGIGVAGDADFLRVAPRQCRAFEVVVEEICIRDVHDLRGRDLGEAAAGHDTVQQTGIVVADGQALLRTARAPPADGEEHGAVVLDEPFFHHHETLGGEHLLAVVAEDIQRGGRHPVALREMQMLEDAAVPDAGSLDVPAAHAAAAERVDQSPVPRRRRRERSRD